MTKSLYSLSSFFVALYLFSPYGVSRNSTNYPLCNMSIKYGRLKAKLDFFFDLESKSFQNFYEHPCLDVNVLFPTVVRNDILL